MDTAMMDFEFTESLQKIQGVILPKDPWTISPI